MNKKFTKHMTPANHSASGSSRTDQSSDRSSSNAGKRQSSGVSLGKISFQVGENVTIEYDSKGTLTLRCKTRHKEKG